ncbi:MAG: group I intron-associated PD-(D/E)XK endonuclease [Terriglobales bacterium]
MQKTRKVHNKVAGEFAELCFMKKAASLGLVVSKPLGDSMPYDIVVDNGSCLRRVQVKSTAHRIGGGFSIATARLGGGKARLYSASEIDFLVAYIVPDDIWYILPIRILARRQGIRLFPHTRNSRSRYHKYREAWHLLLPEPSPRRIFAQADTGRCDDLISHIDRIADMSDLCDASGTDALTLAQRFIAG